MYPQQTGRQLHIRSLALLFFIHALGWALGYCCYVDRCRQESTRASLSVSSVNSPISRKTTRELSDGAPIYWKRVCGASQRMYCTYSFFFLSSRKRIKSKTFHENISTAYFCSYIEYVNVYWRMPWNSAAHRAHPRGSARKRENLGIHDR